MGALLLGRGFRRRDVARKCMLAGAVFSQGRGDSEAPSIHRVGGTYP